MPVTALDSLLAIKIINLIPGLRQSDRRVAVVLIEHFNRRTGRCDPGLERIAKLLGVCTRTVIRATQRLETTGMFRKVRHGGYSNRNSYEPNWQCFAAFEASWQGKFRGESLLTQTRLSPASGQPSHVGGDLAVTQTCRRNLHKQTCSTGHPNERKAASIFDRAGLRPISNQIKPGDAGLAAAERRWSDALHKRFSSMPDTYAKVIEATDSAMQATATEAEMRIRGAGLAYILARLKIADGR